jgi:hypothetical protein
MMRALTTTVTTPAASRDLVTLDDLRLQLSFKSTDTSQDVWLSKAITRASRQADGYCNRIFVEQTYRDYFTAVNGMPGNPLILGQAPLDSVILTVDGSATPLDDSNFIIDADPGHLYWIGDSGGWTAQSSIVIDYTAGFAEIPDDVQQAVIELAVMEFRARGRDPMLRERETPGLGREMFWIGPPPGGSTALPSDICGLLDGYARSLVG